MNKNLALSNIDFADSEFISFRMDVHNLIIVVRNWKEEPLELIFKQTIQFVYKLGDVPKNLYELKNTSFLKEALEIKYVTIPSNHSFKHFQIEDIDDFPFIQIIAENVAIQSTLSY